MKRKLSLFASSTLVAFLVAGAAQAQSGNEIDELVVTAQRREQSLQDVPVAVSAFTSEKRDMLGINSVADMTNFTPGLSYSTQTDRTSLRGIGRLTNVHAAEGPVAIYNDGIYTSSTVLAGAKGPLFVDRVEVLRGPQGTLYGRNAIAGAINVISKRPTEDMYGEIRASYANYNHSLLEAAVSGPTWIPGVQFRLAANWEKQTEGWYNNIVPGVEDEGNIIDTKIFEGQLQFQFNENFEGWFSASTIVWDNGGGGPGSRQSWTPAAYPTYETVNAGLSLSAGFGCRTGTGATATGVVNASPAGCVNPQLTDPWTIATTFPYKVSLDETAIFASEWVYHFEGVDLKYITGGTRYHYHLATPLENAPITRYTLPAAAPAFAITAFPTTISSYEEIERWYSHEINLSSTGDGDLQWLLGLYHYREDFEQPVSAYVPNQPQFGSTPYPFLCLQTGAVCAQNPERKYFDSRPVGEIQSDAVYGQIDWAFAPTWKFTLGLRYSEDTKNGTEGGRILCFAVAACFAAPELNGLIPLANGSGGLVPLVDLSQTASVVSIPAAGATLPKGITTRTTWDPATGLAYRSFDAGWSSTTGTAGLQWEPDSDTMAYVRYSRGFKPGGFRFGIDTALTSSPFTESEDVDAYEVGLKKNFSTLQTNVAVFRYNYSNAQVPLSIVATSGGLAQVQSIFYNVPKAISQGIELEAIWQPVQGLQVLFNYSYNDAHVTEGTGVIDPVDPAALDPQAKPVGTIAGCTSATYGDATTTCAADIYTSPRPVRNAAGAITATSLTPNAAGGYQRGQSIVDNQLPNSPKNKVALAVTYTFDLGDSGTLTPSATYTWRDEQFGSLFNRSYTRAPAWDQFDLRLTWKDSDDKLRVTLWGKNLMDEIGYETGPGAARRAGTVNNNPLLGQVPNNFVDSVATQYQITPPRTYGVDLQYKFW